MKIGDEIFECTLCRTDMEKDEGTHLSLYVSGSEGVFICLSCRQTLTDCARGIRSASSRAHKKGWESFRRTYGKKEKNNVCS